MNHHSRNLAPFPDSSEPLYPFLRSVFLSFPQAWVWDYMLDADCTTDMSILTSPASVQHTVLVDMRTYAVSLQKGTNPLGLPGDFHTIGVMVPAFTIGKVTVGVLVGDLNDTSGTVWPCRRVKRISRFAYDLDSGQSIGVQLDSQDEFAVVISFTFLSAALRRRAFLLFAADSFRLALSDIASKGFDFDLLQKSILGASVAKEQRRCPCCDSPPSTWCGCKLQLTTPKHSLDYEHFPQSYAMMIGHYKGSYSVNYFPGGRRDINVYTETYSEFDGATAFSFAPDLLKWALQNRVQGRIVHPSASAVSGYSSETQNIPLMGHSNLARDPKELQICASEASPVLPFGPSAVDSVQVSHSRNGNQIESSRLSAGSEKESVVQDACEAELGNRALHGEEIISLHIANIGNDQDLVAMNLPCENTIQNFAEECRNLASTDLVVGGQSLGTFQQEAETAFSSLSDAPTIMQNAPGDLEAMRTTGVSPASECHFVPIAPLPQQDSDGTRDIPNENREESELSPEEKKMMVRKLRNRESAARSNLKRRLRNEARKRELAGQVK